MSPLADLAGRIRDTDSHEMVPAGLWTEVFGDVTGPMAQFFIENHDPNGKNSFAASRTKDDAPISPETEMEIWQAGGHAPGAIDMKRRLEVLDLLGVSEQIVLPTATGFMGLIMLGADPAWFSDIFGINIGIDLDPAMLHALGWALLRATNDWAIETAKVSPRLRSTAFIDTGDLKLTLEEAERVIAGGVRAVAIPGGNPPAGESPAHRSIDPLWEMFAENDIAVIFHYGADFGFLRNPVWHRYEDDWEAFGKKNITPEASECGLNPYAFSQCSIASQNILTAMIFGGVFDRFPNLRVGVLECSAHWVGPTVENMFHVGSRFPSKLELTPAEYFQRNIRVAPFWWEPVDQYIERFGLEDVYVLGSDYPHYEGGPDPLNRAFSRLEKLGPEIVEKYFVKNAELICP